MTAEQSDDIQIGEPAAAVEVAAAGTPESVTEEPSGDVAEPETSARVADDLSTPVEDALLELAGKLDILMQSVEEANRLSGERERIIDRLHQENQQLRQGELQQAVLPVFRDLVRLYDDLKQTAGAYGPRAEVTPAEAARDFGLFAEMVADILYRQGVERYEAREGDAFNTKEHRVLGAIETPEPDKDRTIARSVRDGFRGDARVIRPLEAEVYRYVPAAAQQEISAEDK